MLSYRVQQLNFSDMLMPHPHRIVFMLLGYEDVNHGIRNSNFSAMSLHRSHTNVN